jgi:uncharacterized membrane protein
MSLAAVLLTVGIVLLVISFWRQIAILMLFVITTVFCFGVYNIVSTISHILSP